MARIELKVTNCNRILRATTLYAWRHQMCCRSFIDVTLVSLYNRSKTLLLENCAIVFMYWNIETMFLDMRIWLSIRDIIICQVWMSEHWSLFLYISILWRHEEIVRQRTSCTMLRHSVVMQHRVSDRPLSIISKENIHNVK